MFAGNDVIAISLLGGASGNSDNGFWKGDPDFIFMFNWHCLSILNGLDVIRLFYLTGIFLRGDILRVFEQTDPQNVH